MVLMVLRERRLRKSGWLANDTADVPSLTRG